MKKTTIKKGKLTEKKWEKFWEITQSSVLREIYSSLDIWVYLDIDCHKWYARRYLNAKKIFIWVRTDGT